MKIAIAVSDDSTRVSGHAGQARHWLLYDCLPGQTLPEPERLELTKEQLPHHFKDDGPHPLHGVEILVAGSGGRRLPAAHGQMGRPGAADR